MNSDTSRIQGNNNPRPGPLAPYGEISSINGLVSIIFRSVGIEPTDEESTRAMTMGTVVAAAGLKVPDFIKNPPSWLVPSVVGLGFCIAVKPAVKDYFSSPNRAIAAPNNAILEPVLPEVVPLSLSSLQHKNPTRINYSANHVAPLPPVNAVNETQMLQSAQMEVQTTRLNIGITPLYNRLLQVPNENQGPNPSSGTESFERSCLAYQTISRSLNEIDGYINNMMPVLAGRIKLRSVLTTTNQALGSITTTNTIGKNEIRDLLGKINDGIETLQHSLASLQENAQMIVPTIDYANLRLPTTETVIRLSSLDDRILAAHSLETLKETYKTALDAIAHLCDLKDSMDELNGGPTSDKLLRVISLLKTLSEDISKLSSLEHSPLAVQWLRDVTQDYTKLVIEYLTQAAKATTRELTGFMNLSRDTKIPEARHKFITELKNMINTENLVQDLRADFNKLGTALETLRTTIKTTQAWQPVKNTALTIGTSLAVTAAITTVRLGIDIVSAVWQKR